MSEEEKTEENSARLSARRHFEFIDYILARMDQSLVLFYLLEDNG